MRRFVSLSFFLALISGSSAVFAQRDLKNIPDPDPELERQALQLADGFEINLFAADPQIAKPIQMNFDPQGRLWIASSEVYPQIAPGQKANDRILVVEDVDGDGKADKTTVFADGLLIPTAVEPGDGGAYVANSTELVHLTDTDGDGKADKSRVVLSGFGTEDTHHILHTFRWGPDGMLYMNQSIYIHSHIETPYGVRRLNAGGIWQFRPETMRLDVYARGWINSWGHQLDEYGQSFATDGAGGEGINFVVPGAAYPTATLIPKILHGLNPGSPKYCGMEIVGGRHLPDDWQGNILTNDFRGHRVCRFALSDDGSGFAAKQLPDLVRTNHVAFRPIDIKIGPDGAIYIADWYNPIIQHGEVDFRDPRRDHVHGRIWRVTAKGRPLVPKPKIVGATNEELVALLKSPEMWTRHQAKRVIKERAVFDARVITGARFAPGPKGREESEKAPGAAGPPAKQVLVELLREFATSNATDDPLIERHKLESLWTHQTIDQPDAALLSSLLRAKDFRVRAAATRVVGHWADRLPNSLDLMALQVSDPHPRVRLEAIRVLGQFRDPRAFSLVLRALDAPVDTWIDYAAWLACRELEPIWLPRLREGKLPLGSESQHLAFALKAVNSPAVVPALVELVRQKRLAGRELTNVLALIADLGNPQELRPAFEWAIAEGTSPDDATIVLNGLSDAARKRGVRPSGELTGVERIASSASATPALKAAALRAAGAWKLESARELLHREALDKSAPAASRLAAIDGLQSLGGPQSLEALRVAATPASPRPIRAAAVAALGAIDAKTGAQAAVALLQDLKESPAEAEPILLAALSRKDGAAFLAEALDTQPLPSDVAKIMLRTLSAAGRAHPALEAALRTSGGITGGPKTLTAEEMTALIAEVGENGDPAAGELVFRRKDLACQKCHAIGGAGGAVGPDLVSIGASAQIDYLIDSLFAPNKQVKEGYQTVVVETTDGLVRTGIKIRQTENDLILRTIDDQEINVPLKSIEDQSNGTTLMPVGLTDALTRKELVDLVRFLSELGKVGPFSIRREPVVRVLESVNITDEVAAQLDPLDPEKVASLARGWDWNAITGRVAGDIPLDEATGKSWALLRFHVFVSAPGAVRFDLDDPAGVTIIAGGESLKADEGTRVKLAEGRHTILALVDRRQRKTSSLRIILKESVGTPAKFRLETGR